MRKDEYENLGGAELDLLHENGRAVDGKYHQSLFLAAMSSSRSDVVTKFVCVSVRSSVCHEGVFLSLNSICRDIGSVSRMFKITLLYSCVFKKQII